jgi:hypothetical protein
MMCLLRPHTYCIRLSLSLLASLATSSMQSPLQGPTSKILPLYITIVPQCAGKTTYLSKMPSTIDIAIDDQKGTYEAVDVRTALGVAMTRRYRKDMPTVWCIHLQYSLQT